ncbi:ankyrin repeat and SOCS box protein 9-like [Halyomorpha halys]|uniref:ankyrin repeat and SOCS box protein 9-like n=1 Tax=Halyomorpha halys TaxID=286706 RepID=UPI0034D2EAFC
MNTVTQDTPHQAHAMVNGVRRNRSSLYKVLTKMKTDNGLMIQNDPLRRTILSGQIGLAITMIEQGCFVNSLHLIDAIRKDYIEIVKLIIALGVDVNGEDLQGENSGTYKPSSPLYKAVEEDKVECVRLLLEAGAKVDEASGTDGWTPLQRASMLHNIPIAKMLVECGANPNKKAPEGWTPIQLIRNKRYNKHGLNL